jgi:hypothetical protein
MCSRTDFVGKGIVDMLGFRLLSRRLAAGAAALALTFVPLAALAQDVPSYARPAVSNADETIHGRIRSVDGAFNISVDDDRGFIDSVQLHEGTIINPTGLTLSEGMSVTILGVNAGDTFDANEIDTPYTYSGPLPTPVFYGDGYWCPGFAYGYGPSFSLAIVFGGGRPWYYEHRPFHGRPWNGHGDHGAWAGAGPGHGRVGWRGSFDSPQLRAQTGVAPRVGPGYAGRTFGGESRSVPYQRGTQPIRGAYEHGTQTTRAGGTYERAGGGHERRAGGYERPAGGFERPAGGSERPAGGSERAGGAGQAPSAGRGGGQGGGGRAH